MNMKGPKTCWICVCLSVGKGDIQSIDGESEISVYLGSVISNISLRLRWKSGCRVISLRLYSIYVPFA